MIKAGEPYKFLYFAKPALFFVLSLSSTLYLLIL